jgi:hypothetical protein
VTWKAYFGRRAAILATSLALALCGCGPAPVYQVRGKVNFEGKPMQGGGSISFAPLGEQPGKAAGGMIAPDGTYELMTHRPGDGSMAGDFRVTITQVTQEEPQNTGEGTKRRVVPPALAQELRIPDIYADPLKSPLTAKVEAKPSNEINFDLKRQ